MDQGRKRSIKDSSCGGDAKRGKSFSIGYEELGTLCMAAKHVPERTPNRMNLIATLVNEGSRGVLKENFLSVIIGNSDDLNHSVFDGSASSCKDTLSTLLSNYKDIFDFSESNFEEILYCHSDKTALKPFILLPPVRKCCGDFLLIRNRPSFPLVYTCNGTGIGALFNGECRKSCGKKFSYSYYQIGDKTFSMIVKGNSFT